MRGTAYRSVYGPVGPALGNGQVTISLLAPEFVYMRRPPAGAGEPSLMIQGITPTGTAVGY